MAIPLTKFQEPGFFSQVQEVSSLFLLPGAVQVVALVGTGKASKSVLQEQLTRAANASPTEVLANSAASITRVYSNAVFQYPTSSYATSMIGSVDLSGGHTFTAATDEKLYLEINGVAAAAVTFTTGSPQSLAQIVSTINGAGLGIAAVASGNFLKLTSSTTGDGGKKIKVLTGTNNANTVLGFTADQVCNRLDWTPSIASASGSIRPQQDDVYFVDYETPKVAADFKPQFFFGQAAVNAAYGDASASNTISLGANGAFANGASVVVCRQLDPAQVAAGASATRTEMDAALADLELVDCDIVVPMLTDEAEWASYLNHVSKMSSQLERKERIAILGLDETGGRISTLGNSPSWSAYMGGLSASGGLQPSRLVVVNPGACKVTIKGTQLTLDGSYIAACLAGRMVAADVDTATSMTYKTLATIDQLIIPELSRSEKNTLTSLGVTIVESVSGNIRVRRSMTADTTSIAKEEPSIVRSFDQVARQMREALETRFVGTKITLNTPNEVASAVNVFLLNFVNQELIAAFRNVSVKQNASEPRQIDISFEALPIFPFLWGSLNITITLS